MILRIISEQSRTAFLGPYAIYANDLCQRLFFEDMDIISSRIAKTEKNVH